LAADDKIELKNLVTDPYFTEMKTQTLHVPKGCKAIWTPLSVTTSVVMWRHISVHQTAYEFAQITCRFDTKQSLAVYNAKGEIVAGNKEPTKVVDYWVFERSLKKDNVTPWRLCGRINPDQPQPQEHAAATIEQKG